MANIKISQQIFANFSGGYASEQASASQNKVSFIGDSKNIDIYPTENNLGFGFKKTLGNVLFKQIPNEKIKNLFVYKVGQNTDYLIVHTVTDDEAKLYYLDRAYNAVLIKSGLDKDATQASFVNFSQTLPDRRYLGIFSNGSDPMIKFELGQDPEVEEIDAQDEEGRDIRGVTLEVFFGRVWCGVGDRIHWSKALDPFVWSTEDDDAGYNQLDGDITSLSTYDNGLIISTTRAIYYCTKTSSEDGFTFTSMSPNFAVSSRTIVKHANYALYMSDDGIYPINSTQENTKKVDEDISWLIGNYYRKKDSFRYNEMFATSITCQDRNEVWFHIPLLNDEGLSYIFVYRFTQGRQSNLYWLPPRIQPKINCLCVFNNKILSGNDSGEILQEMSGKTFNGADIEAVAEFPDINLNGTYNKQKLKLYIFSELNENNKFYVDYFYNGETEYERQEIMLENQSFDWDTGNWDEENWLPDIILEYKLDKPRKHNRLKLRFVAQNSGQDFVINRIETTKIKVKDK